MIYINQIFPLKYGIEKNRKFFKLLYQNKDLTKVSKWFDKHEGYVARERDTEMTLEKFVELMGDDSVIRIQFASPDPLRIKYFTRQLTGYASNFAWIECPYNDNNFNIFSQLFEKSFKRKLKDEPVDDDLLELYKKSIKMFRGKEPNSGKINF
jgi:hypothetical protein